MKGLSTILIIFILNSALFSQSNHTIAIDGTNNGWTASETFSNISPSGSAYFTWDADYIYFGIAHSEADYGNLTTFMYFDTDPTGSNGTNTAYAWGEYITTPFKADYVVVWKNQYGSDYIEVRNWNGSSWNTVNSATSTTLNVSGTDVVKFATGDDYREVFVKRSYIGNPTAIRFCTFTEQQYGSYWRYFAWPNNGWIDAARASEQGITNYYGFFLISAVNQTSSPYYNAVFKEFIGTGSDWNTAGNWTGSSLPTNTALVLIPASKSVEISTSTTADAFDLVVNGTLTIKSNSSGTGSLIHSSSGVSATVERYVEGHGNVAAEGWHLMGSPVATFNITGSSYQPGTNDDLYAWSESTNTWLNYKAGNPTQIVPGTGYLVAYENTGTKSFSGTLNISNVSVSGLAHNASQGKGWHLLGNPFASALEWNKTGGSWSLTNISGTAKIWNSTSKSYIDIDENGIIPSAQGFFVQVAVSTTGSLTIPATARTHSTTAWYKNTTPRILLSASPADGSSRQESQIRLEPEATAGFDFYWDSRFLEGYAPKFYSIAGNEKLSTNAMPALPNGTGIPFGFEKNQHSSFVIRLEESLPGETIFLKDLKLNTVHNLNENPEYLFSANQGDDPNRFLLVFGTVGVDEKPAAQAQLQAYMANGRLWVNNPAENSQLAVFDLSGRLLVQQQLRSKGLQQLSLNLQKGAYILRLTEGSSSLSTKVINQ